MNTRLSRLMAFALLAVLSLLAALPVSSAGPLTGKSVCIDPGHGGMDSGAYNAAYNLYESEVNLDISYALSALLEGAGATVFMARTGDEDLTNSERYFFCNRTRATILISVHTNSFADPEPNGTLVFYGKRSAAEDMSLAQALHDELYPVLKRTAADPGNFTNYGVRRYGATVIRRSTMPASLVEPVFMSNPAEAQLLVTPIYTAPGSDVFRPGCVDFSCRRGQIAQAIYRGVLNYFAESVVRS